MAIQSGTLGKRVVLAIVVVVMVRVVCDVFRLVIPTPNSAARAGFLWQEDRIIVRLELAGSSLLPIFFLRQKTCITP